MIAIMIMMIVIVMFANLWLWKRGQAYSGA